jgi:hypothetical protein
VTDKKQPNYTNLKECDLVTDKNHEQPEIFLTEDDFQGVTL